MTQKLIAGPLQGYTEAPYRHFHAGIFGGVDLYCAPFARMERGEMRPKDVRELTSDLNANHRLLPQVIFNSGAELATLLDRIALMGHTMVDLNLGCPFPPQVKKGRGAGLLLNPERLEEAAAVIAAHPELKFTAKMRLGVKDAGEWREAVRILDAMPLEWLTVHPRIAAEQYEGDLHIAEFEELLGATRHRIVYNGGIESPADAERIVARYPQLHGLMLGRGLLGRPALAAEVRGGAQMPLAEVLPRIMEMHDAILDHYSATLCGDTQILMKIKPFWDYLEPTIGRAAAKAIRKAGSMTRYRAAVSDIEK